MKIKPVGPSVLVRMDDVEEVSQGGIVLAKDFVDKEQGGCVSGVVKAIGGDAFRDIVCHEDGADIQVGDRVVFERYKGFIPYVKDVPDDVAQKWRIMNDDDIRAVISTEGVDINE